MILLFVLELVGTQHTLSAAKLFIQLCGLLFSDPADAATYI
jgi:hypothetical protein